MTKPTHAHRSGDGVHRESGAVYAGPDRARKLDCVRGRGQQSTGNESLAKQENLKTELRLAAQGRRITNT